MAKRKIINIDQDKCNGCGQCIPNCPEGALRVIDGKARLVSDLFCDGLGACIGHCPQGAITIKERQANPYDEHQVMRNIVKQGQNVIRAHLQHLKQHQQTQYFQQAVDFLKLNNIPVPETEPDAPLPCGCAGSQVQKFARKEGLCETSRPGFESCLRNWPVQLKLVPVNAPYLKEADLLIAADCLPFTYADFHHSLLKGKILLIGCPKLDDADFYKQKLTQIFKQNSIKSITAAHMEVPCCFGLMQIIKEAQSSAGKDIPVKEVTIGIKGEVKSAP